MAAYDQVGGSLWRLDRADDLPPGTFATGGKLLGWLGGMLGQDRHYHTVMATLTASENYPSTVVRAAAAFVGGEHYFFDAPSPRALRRMVVSAVRDLAGPPDEVLGPDEAAVRR